MSEAIRDMINDGTIGAIALDSQVFFEKQYALETGLLRRLEQFADGSIALLIPQVVAEEVTSQMSGAITEAYSNLRRALRVAEQTNLASLLPEAAVLFAALNERGEALDARALAHDRIGSWKNRTGACILRSEGLVTLEEVMQRYFRTEAPFANSGAKKHEFPDAVALLTLERWAETNGKKVLLVSKDSDWGRYCAGSSRLLLERDLATALSVFQDQTADYAARRLAELACESDRIGLGQELLAALKVQSDVIEFEVEATSQFQYEQDVVEATFKEVRFLDLGDSLERFEAIDFDERSVSVQVSAIAVASVSSYFTFQHWDGIDREYVSMGAGRIETEETVEFSAIVNLQGQIPERMTIASVEVLPGSHYLELFDVEPNWMRADYQSEE
jgi:hypothetical protein